MLRVRGVHAWHLDCAAIDGCTCELGEYAVFPQAIGRFPIFVEKICTCITFLSECRCLAVPLCHRPDAMFDRIRAGVWIRFDGEDLVESVSGFASFVTASAASVRLY
jgi:hypothetical protein